MPGAQACVGSARATMIICSLLRTPRCCRKGGRTRVFGRSSALAAATSSPQLRDAPLAAPTSSSSRLIGPAHAITVAQSPGTSHSRASMVAPAGFPVCAAMYRPAPSHTHACRRSLPRCPRPRGALAPPRGAITCDHTLVGCAAHMLSCAALPRRPPAPQAPGCWAGAAAASAIGRAHTTVLCVRRCDAPTSLAHKLRCDVVLPPPVCAARLTDLS